MARSLPVDSKRIVLVELAFRVIVTFIVFQVVQAPVTGKVIEDRSASSAEPAPASGGDDDDGPSDLVLAAGGIGGIVVGLVGGGALAGMGRRRPA